MTPLHRFLEVVLPVLVALLLVVPAAALPAGNEGCVFITQGTSGFRGDIPACAQGGGGCYECAISATDKPDYYFCTEEWIGQSPPHVNCATAPWFPDWWPDPDFSNTGTGTAGLPPDYMPPQDWGGDEGPGQVDYGAGGGGFDCPSCPPLYYTPLPPAYAPPGSHAAYQP
jgi:hypothetical protein